MKLSPHFSLAELTVSQAAARRGISNAPPRAIIAELERTAMKMETVRALLNDKPILISSGYRSPAVNKAVGGSNTSAHTKGMAVDFICPGFGTVAEVAAHLSKHLGEFDQLIEEFGGWVHIGFGPGRRMQRLTARKVNGRTRYTTGIAGG